MTDIIGYSIFVGPLGGSACSDVVGVSGGLEGRPEIVRMDPDPSQGNDEFSLALTPFLKSSQEAQPEGQASTSNLPPDQPEVASISWSRLESVFEKHLRHYTHWKCVKKEYPGLDSLLNYKDCAGRL